MIVATTASGIRLVTQSDHARFAADLLQLFRLPELVDHPRRAILLRAVAEHDNGWWEADAAPRRAATGTAVLDFRAFPPQLRQEIWQRGVERFAADCPYLAALIATHSLRLLRPLAEELTDPSWAACRKHLAQRREELLAAAGETLATLAADDPWLEVADDLSLAVCTGDSGFVNLPGWRAQVQGERDVIELALQPFPLAGITSFELACRWLEPGRPASAVELARALASSTWTRIRIRVRRL